jgi:hypothetical protein
MRVFDLSDVNNKSALLYESIGIVFIIFLGATLHFTFEWSGSQPAVGIFSAVNESVWEHLKLAFWPALLYLLLESRPLSKSCNNFLAGKTSGAVLMISIIPIIFYSYTSVTGASIFIIDISSFVISVVIGQLVSYKLLTYRKLPKVLDTIALLALVLLAVCFVMFTFYAPQIPIFRDPITGRYGIP